MEVLKMILIYLAIAFISNVIAFVFTEVRKPLINVKPFNCYGCAAFWLTLIGGAFYAGYRGEWLLVALALCCAFWNFIYVKLKYKVYD